MSDVDFLLFRLQTEAECELVQSIENHKAFLSKFVKFFKQIAERNSADLNMFSIIGAAGAEELRNRQYGSRGGISSVRHRRCGSETASIRFVFLEKFALPLGWIGVDGIVKIDIDNDCTDGFVC